MAFKQALSIGTGDYVYKCSILKEEEIEFAYYSSASNPVYWTDEINSSASYWDKYYTSIGDNFNEYLSGTVDTNPRYFILNNVYASYHALGVVCSLNDKEFLCCDVTRSGVARGPLSFCYTNHVKKPMTPSTINKFGYTIPTYEWSSGMRGLLTIVFDDSLGELNFIVLHSIRTDQSSLYSLLNTVEARKEAYSKLRDFLDTPSSDPWISGGESTTGGGDGNLDITSDTITQSSFPPSAIDTGFIQAFAPSLAEIKELSSYMWNDSFLNMLVRLWDNPMDIIISLTQFPFFIPSTNSRNVQAGNVETPVRMRVPDSQYVTLDCGKLTVNKYYDGYVDFEPYTSCDIYLPYIGTQKLSMDDISGKELNVVYNFDILSGCCVCNIYVNGSIMYTFSGNCGVTIPISSQSYGEVVKNSLQVGLSSFGKNFTGNVTNVAGAVMSAKPSIERSGQVGSNSGIFSPQKPYLTLSIPRVCLPKNQNTFIGYPSFVETKLSKLTGFTRIFDIRLSGMSCTDAECKQIVSLLKEGVIL